MLSELKDVWGRTGDSLLSTLQLHHDDLFRDRALSEQFAHCRMRPRTGEGQALLFFIG